MFVEYKFANVTSEQLQDMVDVIDRSGGGSITIDDCYITLNNNIKRPSSISIDMKNCHIQMYHSLTWPIFCDDDRKTSNKSNNKQCTCGSIKCGLPTHSSWCDLIN